MRMALAIRKSTRLHAGPISAAKDEDGNHRRGQKKGGENRGNTGGTPSAALGTDVGERPNAADLFANDIVSTELRIHERTLRTSVCEGLRRIALLRADH